jgi:hypothetical protein
MHSFEKDAYIKGGQMAHEYAKSIGKSDLAQFTGEEWLTFCECMCKNYHDAYAKDDRRLTEEDIPF